MARLQDWLKQTEQQRTRSLIMNLSTAQEKLAAAKRMNVSRRPAIEQAVHVLLPNAVGEDR